MAEPFSLVPLAIAARGGSIDGHGAGALVAGGLTLLQRSAPLVRALSGRHAAIILPPGGAFVTALAASDGRSALLVSPDQLATQVAATLRDAAIGAVFTTTSWLAAHPEAVPSSRPVILLDEAPRRATLVIDGATRTIDLGSHYGLELEGAADAEGSDEVIVLLEESEADGTRSAMPLTHRALLADARAVIAACNLTPDDRVLALPPVAQRDAFVSALIAPLLAGASVQTRARIDAAEICQALDAGNATVVVGDAHVLERLTGELATRGRAPDSAAAAATTVTAAASTTAMLTALPGADDLASRGLRLFVVAGAPPDESMVHRWTELTRVPVRQA